MMKSLIPAAILLVSFILCLLFETASKVINIEKRIKALESQLAAKP